MKDLIGGTAKDPSECKRQLKAGYVAVALNRVDALAGNASSLRQLLLHPSAGDAEPFDSICDCKRYVKSAFHMRVAQRIINVKLTFHFSHGYFALREVCRIVHGEQDSGKSC